MWVLYAENFMYVHLVYDNLLFLQIQIPHGIKKCTLRMKYIGYNGIDYNLIASVLVRWFVIYIYMIIHGFKRRR